MDQDRIVRVQPRAWPVPAPTTLRDSGVYTLPPGGRLIALRLDDGWLLYTLTAWTAHAPATYEVADDGHLLRGGQPTAWTVADLVDA